jgi:hypothetical protein
VQEKIINNSRQRYIYIILKQILFAPCNFVTRCSVIVDLQIYRPNKGQERSMTTTTPITPEEFYELSRSQERCLVTALVAKTLVEIAKGSNPNHPISTDLENAWNAIQADQFGTFYGREIDISAPKVQEILNILQEISLMNTEHPMVRVFAPSFYDLRWLLLELSGPIGLPPESYAKVRELSRSFEALGEEYYQYYLS